MRPKGTTRPTSAIMAAPMARKESVSIMPGSTPFTVMLCFAISNAAARMKPFTPPLDAA